MLAVALSKTTCFPVFGAALNRRPSGAPDGGGVVSGGFDWGVATSQGFLYKLSWTTLKGTVSGEFKDDLCPCLSSVCVCVSISRPLPETQEPSRSTGA